MGSMLFTIMWFIVQVLSHDHDPDFQQILDNFECNTPRINYFQNDPTKPIPSLPQVRLMMCGYHSQCALQFIGYLFMKEKLGMDVTFCPTLDPDSIWNGEYWDNWASNAYPRNYFKWLADDDMDINFEFWTNQVVRTDSNGVEIFNAEKEFFADGSVDFGGFVGAYGEESIWVPKYWVDSFIDGSANIPYHIKTNDAYRQAMIDGSTNVGATNYIEKYEQAYANEILLGNTPKFDKPNYNIPTVWGSVPSYFMSEYANDLTKNYPDGGMDVSFTTTGTEGSLHELITDLYKNRLPFMANIYNLDVNFARKDEQSGKLQQFEKLIYPRNPDQSPHDECYKAKKCQYPISPIMKAANPLLQKRFPEASEFFNVFQVSTSQINLLVSKFLARENDDMTTLEKWLHATCDWMNDEASEDTWNNGLWNIDIVRTDCNQGCDASEGTCDYFTGVCSHVCSGNSCARP